jgi:hypothetical protein
LASDAELPLLPTNRSPIAHLSPICCLPLLPQLPQLEGLPTHSRLEGLPLLLGLDEWHHDERHQRQWALHHEEHPVLHHTGSGQWHLERCREGRQVVRKGPHRSLLASLEAAPLKSQPRPLQVPHIGPASGLAVVFQGKPASLLRNQERRSRLRKMSRPSQWIDDMASPQVCQSLAFHCQWFLCNLSLSELQRKRS